MVLIKNKIFNESPSSLYILYYIDIDETFNLIMISIYKNKLISYYNFYKKSKKFEKIYIDKVKLIEIKKLSIIKKIFNYLICKKKNNYKIIVNDKFNLVSNTKIFFLNELYNEINHKNIIAIDMNKINCKDFNNIKKENNIKMFSNINYDKYILLDKFYI